MEAALLWALLYQSVFICLIAFFLEIEGGLAGPKYDLSRISSRTETRPAVRQYATR